MLGHLAGLDETVRAQPGQVLGQRGLAEVDVLADFRDGHLALRQHAEDHEPVIVGQVLQEFRRGAGRLAHHRQAGFADRLCSLAGNGFCSGCHECCGGSVGGLNGRISWHGRMRTLGNRLV